MTFSQLGRRVKRDPFDGANSPTGVWEVTGQGAWKNPGPQWPRRASLQSRPRNSHPVVALVARQVSGLGTEISPRAAKRMNELMEAISAKDSIFPTVFPDDDGEGVCVIWVAGGEKLQADVAPAGEVYVRHVLADGRVRLSGELPWASAAEALRYELAALSVKTSKANPEWRQLYAQW